MKIAYLAGEDTGNAFYRGIAPMTALRARGHHVVKLPPAVAKLSQAAVQDVDVLFVHRFTEEAVQRLAKAAKARGTCVVWDNDDDHGGLPRGTALHRKYGGIAWERRLAGMRRLFAFADLVTAPSRSLADTFAAAGARRTAVVENYVPRAFLRSAQRPHDGTVVGWIAGLEHQLDVERLDLRSVFERLLDDCPQLRVRTFGVNLGLRSERSSHVPVVPLMRLTEEATAFDLGIAPLADLGLNRARSNIKLKEYAAAGLPWLASPLGPYLGLGEKQGGRLVGDDRWYEEIRRLLDKPRDRGKLQKHAVKWVAGETLEDNAYRWEELLLDAVQRSRTTVGA